MDYLESLNEMQKEAVLHTDGPLLILAGAGAGKTKTLTHRIAHLIHTGVFPEKILAVTFTNKAAAEMKERVKAILSNRKYDAVPHVSTFHSLGVFILKKYLPNFLVAVFLNQMLESYQILQLIEAFLP